jgi:xanthine dehydrogenase YagS FAD-binding subunit
VLKPAAELADAQPREHNAFKVQLAQRAIVRGLEHVLNGAGS